MGNARSRRGVRVGPLPNRPPTIVMIPKSQVGIIKEEASLENIQPHKHNAKPVTQTQSPQRSTDEIPSIKTGLDEVVQRAVPKFVPGTIVLFRGLKATQWNGKQATVVGFKQERYQVMVEQDEGPPISWNVKPDNLVKDATDSSDIEDVLKPDTRVMLGDLQAEHYNGLTARVVDFKEGRYKIQLTQLDGIVHKFRVKRENMTVIDGSPTKVDTRANGDVHLGENKGVSEGSAETNNTHNNDDNTNTPQQTVQDPILTRASLEGTIHTLPLVASRLGPLAPLSSKRANGLGPIHSSKQKGTQRSNKSAQSLKPIRSRLGSDSTIDTEIKKKPSRKGNSQLNDADGDSKRSERTNHQQYPPHPINEMKHENDNNSTMNANPTPLQSDETHVAEVNTNAVKSNTPLDLKPINRSSNHHLTKLDARNDQRKATQLASLRSQQPRHLTPKHTGTESTRSKQTESPPDLMNIPDHGHYTFPAPTNTNSNNTTHSSNTDSTNLQPNSPTRNLDNIDDDVEDQNVEESLDDNDTSDDDDDDDDEDGNGDDDDDVDDDADDDDDDDIDDDVDIDDDDDIDVSALTSVHLDLDGFESEDDDIDDSDSDDELPKPVIAPVFTNDNIELNAISPEAPMISKQIDIATPNEDVTVIATVVNGSVCDLANNSHNSPQKEDIDAKAVAGSSARTFESPEPSLFKINPEDSIRKAKRDFERERQRSSIQLVAKPQNTGESRGLCGGCGKVVTTKQERVKDDSGVYFHEECQQLSDTNTPAGTENEIEKEVKKEIEKEIVELPVSTPTLQQIKSSPSIITLQPESDATYEFSDDDTQSQDDSLSYEIEKMKTQCLTDFEAVAKNTRRNSTTSHTEEVQMLDDRPVNWLAVASGNPNGTFSQPRSSHTRLTTPDTSKTVRKRTMRFSDEMSTASLTTVREFHGENPPKEVNSRQSFEPEVKDAAKGILKPRPPPS